MINSVTSSHTPDGGRVSYRFQLKSSLLKKCYYDWGSEAWVDVT